MSEGRQNASHSGEMGSFRREAEQQGAAEFCIINKRQNRHTGRS